MSQKFLAYELAVELQAKCESIQAKRYIKDQLDRAALSVVLNLAEGSAKPTTPDQRRFYAMAFGSLRETQALLRILKETEAHEKSDRLGGMVYRLVYPK